MEKPLAQLQFGHAIADVETCLSRSAIVCAEMLQFGHAIADVETSLEKIGQSLGLGFNSATPLLTWKLINLALAVPDNPNASIRPRHC